MKNSFLIVTIVIVVFFGCILPKRTHLNETSNEPSSYIGVSDTTSIGVIKWSDYFTDPKLKELIGIALKQNIDIEISFQKTEAAKAYLLLNKGSLYPSLMFNVSGATTKYGKYSQSGSGWEQTSNVPYPLIPDYMVGLSSTWEVDLWGKLKNRKQSTIYRYLETGMGKNLLTTLILSDVAYKYYELVALDNELDIIQQNIKLQEAALEIINIQKEAGRATELAVMQFSVQVLQTRSMEYQVKQSISETENELNFLLGRYSEKIERNKSIFNQQIPVQISAGIPSQLLYRRPDIISAELELKATKTDIEAIRADFLPSFNLSASMGYNAYYPSVLLNPASIAYNFLGGITAPVFNKNINKSNYDRSVAEHKQAEAQYHKVIMNAVYEVMTSLDKITSLQSQFELNEKEAKILSDAVKIANELYMAGYANYLEVITAQKNALEAELGVVKTRKQLFFSVVNLYRSLGGGW